MDNQTQPTAGYKVEFITLLESSLRRDVQITFDDNAQPIESNILVNTEVPEENPDSKFSVNVDLYLQAMQNEKAVYEVKVKIGASFEKIGEPILPPEVFVKINAPAIIYPFIREHVSTLCLKAGLGNVLLPPVNFKV